MRLRTQKRLSVQASFSCEPPFQYRRLLVRDILPALRRPGQSNIRQGHGGGEPHGVLDSPGVAGEIGPQASFRDASIFDE